ncbi:MAG: riboflavin kinase [Patescibacteria group bacterium]
MGNANYTGVVVKGIGRAAELGFPTVNILLPDGDPVSGIYVGRVTHKDVTYNAVVYADQGRHMLEAHLLDFEKNLYDETITVILFEKLRERGTFPDDASLQKAIAEDVLNAEDYFLHKG